MQRFSCFLSLLFLALCPRPTVAQDPLGSAAAAYPYLASKILADPSRMRVYIADASSNSVAVVDTTTLQVSATIPVGPNPVDMAISRDGNTLYVANNGSTLNAVSVLDLNTLTVSTTFALPEAPVAIAAGLSNRVYASVTSDNFQFVIEQFDGTTGAVQTTFNDDYYDNNIFVLTPDGTTLFEASTNEEPGDLKSFDVSTATPSALQINSEASEGGIQLVVSHNGKYLCLAGGSNNISGPEQTYLYSTADITSYYGVFNSQGYGGPLAFSLDDSLVYQASSGSSLLLDVYSSQTFLDQAEVTLPTFGVQGYPPSYKSVVIDNTGSYLFISGTAFNPSGAGAPGTIGQVTVVTTGLGTLTPTSLLPVISGNFEPNSTQGTPFSYQITASNTPTSYNATGLPPGLSVNTTTGLITGTPSEAGFFQVPISATNASGTATADLDLDVQEAISQSPPVFSTVSLPNARVGQFYSAAVSASNSPISYTSADLPAGLTLGATTGTITGTPTTAGVYSVTFYAANGAGSGMATLTLTVAGPAPAITSAPTAAGEVGLAFAFQLAATNDPTSFGASGLPAGLSIDASTGLISGTPVQAGASAVTVSAGNTSGTGSATLKLTIAGPAPAITSATAATGKVGAAFAYQLAASNAPISFGASGLPAGLSLDASTGLISGTPVQAGAYSVTVSAGNSSGTGSATLLLTIAGPAPAITSATVVAGKVGVALAYQLTASNAPTSFGASGLPQGLSINANTGLISGLPVLASTFPVTVSASNAYGTGSATLSLTIAGLSPAITSATNAAGQIGVAFSYQLLASNAPASFSASGLPLGLSINANTGLISGTPAQAGTYQVTVSAVNTYGTGSATLSLTVAGLSPTINSASTAVGEIGVAFSYQVTATGAPASFGASGLPGGLSINANNGLISGTPAQAGAFPVTISAVNTYGTGAAKLSLTVAAALPAINSRTSASAVIGEAFSFQLTATSNPTSFAAAGLPTGVSINPASGLISGTPNSAGTFAFSVSAINATGTGGPATFTLTVTPSPLAVITSAASATATMGRPFSYQITASNDPTSFSVTGLPPGLTIQPNSGLISGKPSVAGTFRVQLNASNPAGTGTATLILDVAQDLPVATLLVTKPTISFGSGGFGELSVTLSIARRSDLIVHYRIKGTALNAIDYTLLTGTVTFKPGQTLKHIKIFPLTNPEGVSDKTVRITLEDDPGYTVGTKDTGEVKILSGE